MRTVRGYTDLWPLARLERGRDAIGGLMAMAPSMRALSRAAAPHLAALSRRRRRGLPWERASRLGPLWLGLGLGVALASLIAKRRRQRADLEDPGRLRLRDVMITGVHTIEPGATVAETAEYMRQKNVGVLPIVEDGQILGVVTDRDLVVRCLAQREVDPRIMRVKDCATTNPILARANWTPERALLIMADQQIGRLPVVDDEGHLVGMVTLSSLALRSRKPDETLAAAKKVSLRSARDEAA